MNYSVALNIHIETQKTYLGQASPYKRVGSNDNEKEIETNRTRQRPNPNMFFIV